MKITVNDYRRVVKENKELRDKIKKVKRQIKAVYDLVKNDYSPRTAGQQELPLK